MCSGGNARGEPPTPMTKEITLPPTPGGYPWGTGNRRHQPHDVPGPPKKTPPKTQRATGAGKGGEGENREHKYGFMALSGSWPAMLAGMHAGMYTLIQTY